MLIIDELIPSSTSGAFILKMNCDDLMAFLPSPSGDHSALPVISLECMYESVH